MKILYQILSEIGLIFLYPLSALIISFLPQKLYQQDGKGENIVIVERWMTINIRHLYWKYYLQKKGFKVFLVNLPLYRGTFDDSSQNLKNFLESKKLTDVVLVGISAGALTSLIYLEEKSGWTRVSKFISVGAPFRGTWGAVFLLFTHSGWEILPKSDLIKRIAKYDLQNAKNILCIKAKFDEMVPHGAALPRAHKYSIDVVGHNNLHLRVRSTYKKIIEFASS